jgi:hypothetical protein
LPLRGIYKKTNGEWFSWVGIYRKTVHFHTEN